MVLTSIGWKRKQGFCSVRYMAVLNVGLYPKVVTYSAMEMARTRCLSDAGSLNVRPKRGPKNPSWFIDGNGAG